MTVAIDISAEDLFYAYRKAKADCYFERSINMAKEFSEYEEDLPKKLQNLRSRIKREGVLAILSEGEKSFKVVAKKLGVKRTSSIDQKSAHGFFADPARAFSNLKSSFDLTPEFRLIGDFSVETHILSALWVNCVGHKFDACLGTSAFGSRLRRFRGTSHRTGDYHKTAIGSFQPYFPAYKAWRALGLKAIRSELMQERPVIAMTMDFSSYFHRLSPAFLLNERFLREIGVELTPKERLFTKDVVSFLSDWSRNVAAHLRDLGCKPDEGCQGGLPIGLSMVRVAANAFLAPVDRDIEQGLAPVYYGRYIDDIILVMRDPGNLMGMEDVLQFMSQRTKYFPETFDDKGEIKLKFPESINDQSKLSLQQEKQKLFFLQGFSGIDLLDSIEAQIRNVSSERRLMPAPDRLERMQSAQVLTATERAVDEPDTLRRADGLSVRRLGWSIQLRAMEILARDLRAGDWSANRRRFYQFAYDHVLRPDRILDHIDYFPRLMSLAVRVGDWAEAGQIYRRTIDAINELQSAADGSKIKVNGYDGTTNGTEIWKGFRESTRCSAAEAILRSLPWDDSSGGMIPLSADAVRLCERVGISDGPAGIAKISERIRECDWAVVPYKEHLLREARRPRPRVSEEEALYGAYKRFGDLREFLQRTSGLRAKKAKEYRRFGVRALPRLNEKFRNYASARSESFIPYLFPTRPYTAQEISQLLPGEWVVGPTNQRWISYLRAIRGIWIPDDSVSDHDDRIVPAKSNPPSSPVVLVGDDSPDELPEIRLGITSLLTTDKSYSCAASGKSDCSPERYRRLETIINQAIQAKPKPTHLLLPELSVPERWIKTIAGSLNDAGINLIAGLDYIHQGNEVHSEAVLVLKDNRFKFPFWVQIRQPKSAPAPAEEETLIKKFGKTWFYSFPSTKPVYCHNGFCFGVLVCSELSNAVSRMRFQGNVDSVFVLSWNQDLDTFSALVEASSLDIHAYIALVNNRRFGDSRVRSPAKASYDRDVCRLRGGKNDHIVVVDLDIDGLRKFQSRSKRWPSKEDPYKPVPEGFVIASYRKSIPE